MTNKLSELSKPVFEIEVSGGHWLNCSASQLTPAAGADFTDWPDGVNRLYSQEYVSALLADNEAKDKRIAELSVGKVGNALLERENHHVEVVDKLLARIAELETIRADASQVFKEIGNELGCNPDNESIMAAIDELKEREKRVVALACGNAELWETMASRLEAAEAKLATPVRLPEPCVYEVNGTRFYDRLSESEVIATLREQGFTVEGDE